MTRRALIIGINTEGLQYCVKDADLMTDCLEQHEYRVTSIVEQIRKSEVQDALDNLVDTCDKADTLIFYFSGHGLIERGKLQLLLADERNKRSWSKIPFSNIAEAIEGCRADKRLIILDCCHAGTSHAEWSPDSSDAYRLLTASGRLEKSKEIEALQASFMTYHIHRLLTELPPELLDEQRTVRIETLGDQLQQTARTYNAKSPHQVPIPCLFGNTRADLELAIIPETCDPAHTQPGLSPPERRAEQNYRKLVLDSCDVINLLNMPEDRAIAQRNLDLRQLYVPLRVQVEYNPEAEVDEEQLETLEVRRLQLLQKASGRVSNTIPDQTNRIPVGERLAASRRLVVLGDPGAGKTTMLHWIVTACLLWLNNDPAWSKLPDINTLPDTLWFPILIRCRDLNQMTCINGPLDDMLLHTLRLAELAEDETSVLQSVLRAKLETGEALLLIDGLDEITDPAARMRFCEQVERMSSAYHPDTPIIITSRIVGYREMGRRIGRGFEHVTMVDLTREEKDDFVRRWCEMTERPERQRQAIQELIRDIHSNSRIERMTGNPLLLTTMALVKRKVGQLPHRRADLYREAVGVLLTWRADVDKPLNSREALPQLQYLSYAMCDRGVQQLREDEIDDLLAQMRRDYPDNQDVQRRTPLDFLHVLEQRTAMLVEVGRVCHRGLEHPVYEFRHLTFQEFLAGLALVQGYFPGRDRTRSLAEHVAPLAGRTSEVEQDSSRSDEEKEYIVTENWREPLRLCVTMCSHETNEVLLDILKPMPDEDASQIARPRAVMAASCLADEPDVSEDTARTILKTFVEQVEDRDGKIFSAGTPLDKAAREIVASRWVAVLRECLVQAFCERTADDRVSVGDLCGMINTAKLRRDYDTVNTRLQEQISCILSDKMVERVEAALTIIGGIRKVFGIYRLNPEKLSIPPELPAGLLAMLTGSHAETHAAAWALGLLINPTVSNNLRDQIKQWRWKPSAEELEQLIVLCQKQESDPQAVVWSIRILGYEEVEQAFDIILVRLKHDKNGDVRSAAAYALGKLDNVQAVEPLIVCLDSDEDANVRRAAVEALAKLGDLCAIEPLIARLEQDESEIVRHTVVQVLATLDKDRAIEPLIARLEQDESKIVRRAAAEALGQLGDLCAIEPLIARLEQDESEIVRRTAVQVLATLDKDRAIEPLIARLENDEEWSVRQTTAEVLGKLGDPRAVAPLITCMEHDEDEDVRKAAAQALGLMNDPRAVEPLIARLEHDESETVRKVTVEYLGQLGDPRAVEPIIACLEYDKDEDVRKAAAQALGLLNDLRAVEPIIARLKYDGESYVRIFSALALGILGDGRAITSLLAHLKHDEDEKVRGAAALALGILGDASAVIPLLNKLELDENETVCVIAALALGILGDEHSVTPLIAHLENDEDEDICQAITIVLGMLGNKRAVKPLITYIGKDEDEVVTFARVIFNRLGEPSDFDDVLEQISDNPNLFFVRSIVYRRKGYYEDALHDLDRALELAPENDRIIANRGELLLLMGRYDEAAQVLTRALEIKQIDWYLYQRVLAHRLVGLEDKAQEDIAAAIQYFRRSFYEDEGFFESLFFDKFNLALYYLAQGDNESANKLYQKNRGKSLVRMAITDLDDFLKLFPDHQQAQAMRELLQERLGDL